MYIHFKSSFLNKKAIILYIFKDQSFLIEKKLRVYFPEKWESWVPEKIESLFSEKVGKKN